MRQTAQRVLGVAVVLVALLGPTAGAALADGGALSYGMNRDNLVTIYNQQDNSKLVQSRTDIELDTTSSVTNTNLALAQASCSTCRTVAVAIQVIIVQADATNFQPQNGAAAVNSNCHACDTFAYANQVVVYAHGHISEEAGRYAGQAEQIAERISAVANSQESFPQMSSDLNGLTQQLVSLVHTAITATAPVYEGHQHSQQEQH